MSLPLKRKRGDTEWPAAASDSGQDVAHQVVRSTSQEAKSSSGPPTTPYRIFLSHSGKQKPFVDELDRALKRAGHDTFFDQNSDSLPIGEQFPDRIKQAAETCLLGVVVLSEKFLTSKWPMLELCYLCDSKRRLYPLFYKLSVEDCKSRENRWIDAWNQLAAQDERFDPRKCLLSLKQLLKCSGEPFRGGSEVNYRSDIVSKICNIWPPPAQFEDSHLQGKDRICKEIVDKFNNAKAFCKNASGACVISLYGVGGSGKTSVCRIMVDFYRPEYVGKVFLLELPRDGNNSEILSKCKNAVKILTEASSELLDSCDDLPKVIRQLKERLTKYSVFLAIDNASEKSEDIVAKILETSFRSGTKVLVTSRSSELVHQMLRHGCDNENCHHAVPSMDRREAIDALLHYANYKNVAEVCSNELDRVVDLARFDRSWHPLVLRALGLRLRKRHRENRLDTSFLDLPLGGKEGADVRTVLRTSFDEIKDESRKLIFLDVAVILPCVGIDIYSDSYANIWKNRKGVCRWLSILHGKPYAEVEDDVRQLQYDGLIDVLREDGIQPSYDYDDEVLRIHDLYVEIAEREVANDPRFLFSKCAGKEPEDVQWAKLERIVLLRDGCNDEMLKVMKTREIPNARLLILKRQRWLYRTRWLMEVPSTTRLRFVRMEGFRVEGLSAAQNIVWLDLEECDVKALTDFIEGLTMVQVLRIKNCSVFERPPDLHRHGHLKELCLRDYAKLLPLPKLGHHADLEVLDLNGHAKDKFCSFGKLPKLKFLNFGGCYELASFWELTTLTSLRTLDLSECQTLAELPILEHLTNLERLKVYFCGRLKTIHLRNLIKLRTLDLSNCYNLEDLGPLTNSTRLQTLNVHDCASLVQLPNLEGFSNLETLNFSGCSRLVFNRLNVSSKLRELSVEYYCCKEQYSSPCCSSWGIFACLTGLTNLEMFDLTGCDCVVGIPGLTTLANLNKLNIRRCRNLQSLSATRTFATTETLTLADLRGEPEMECSSAILSSSTRIPDLRNLANLKVVEICECGSLEKLECRNLANLESVAISQCGSLEKLELRELVKLQTLFIDGCGSLKKLDFRDIAILRSVCIQECGSLETLDLRDLANLDELIINGCGSLEKLDLGDLSELSILKFSWCGSLEKLELRDLAKLTVLEIEECGSLEKLELRDPAKLRELYIEGCKSLEKLDLGDLCELSILRISCCGSLEKLELRDLAKLTDLEIEECGSLEKLELRDPAKLRKLKIERCKSLEKLDLGFRGCGSIKEMCLTNLRSLKRIPDLGTLHKLEMVVICGCEALDGLPDFCGFTNLRHLVFSFSGMKPSLLDISSHTNLQTLAITSKAVEIVGLRDFSNHRNLRMLVLPDDRSLKDILDLDRSLSEPPIVRMGWCTLDALTKWTVVFAPSANQGISEVMMFELLRHWIWSLMQGDEKSVVVRKLFLKTTEETSNFWITRGGWNAAHFRPTKLVVVGCLFCAFWLEGQPVAVLLEDDALENVVECVTYAVSNNAFEGLVSVTWAVGVIAALAKQGGESIWRQLRAHETVEKLLKVISDERNDARWSITLPAAFHYLERHLDIALQLRQQGVSALLHHLSDKLHSSRFSDKHMNLFDFKLRESVTLDELDELDFGPDCEKMIHREIRLPLEISRWWETTVAYLGDHAEPGFILKVAHDLETSKST